MDIFIFEILLWSGLILFFMFLRHNLTEHIEQIGFQLNNTAVPSNYIRFANPERVIDVIGSYMDSAIYHYAVIGGKQYQFDHIIPAEGIVVRQSGQCYLSPGLVYVPCNDVKS